MATVRRFATAAVGLVLCLVVTGTPAFALPADLAALPADKKAEMAESYYLAGLQYREVGKDDLAAGMMRLAFALDPTLDPEAIEDPQPQAVAAPALAAPTAPADTTAWTSSVVASQWLRLASAFLAHDADAIVGMLDGSVYAGGDVTRAQAHAALDALFERRPLAGLSLSEVYDTAGIVAGPYDGAADALAGAFEVRVDARVDLAADVPFWGAEQRFVFRPAGGGWLVAAVLSADAQRVPAQWSPAAESAAEAERRLRAAAERRRERAERMAVAQALLDGVERFLNKDTDGVLAALDGTVLLPDGSSVTRESLRPMFDGYFGATPYRGLRARDILTVAPVERLPAGAADRTWRAAVSFEDRYQEALPPIRSGQRFDLRDADGRWVVFAIS